MHDPWGESVTHLLALNPGHFNSNLAREAGGLAHWREKFWDAATRPSRSARRRVAQVERLRYVAGRAPHRLARRLRRSRPAGGRASPELLVQPYPGAHRPAPRYRLRARNSTGNPPPLSSPNGWHLSGLAVSAGKRSTENGACWTFSTSRSASNEVPRMPAREVPPRAGCGRAARPVR